MNLTIILPKYKAFIIIKMDQKIVDIRKDENVGHHAKE